MEWQVRKATLFGLREGWPWWLVNLLATAAWIAAIRYNFFVAKEGIPTAGLGVLAIVVLAFYALTAFRYYLRWRFIRSIAGYTTQGIAVIFQTPAVAERAAQIPDYLQVLSTAVASAVGFWQNYAARKGIEKGAERIHTEIDDGYYLLIGEDLIGILVGVLHVEVLGTVLANRILICWREGCDAAWLASLVRHEVGHVCLFALGIVASVGGAEHHAIFNEERFE